MGREWELVGAAVIARAAATGVASESGARGGRSEVGMATLSIPSIAARADATGSGPGPGC